ncbi:DUF2680 domain-containing protein [Senegalia massiliensis]|uniref:DUF2680 domain-containing protein n=1 Tax=Senegalia massiliensis TaxID=1720316 RepID=A0A845QSN2_9CLOT|nr:DUF2680 domain-containing protein [Senegalia massiliensis]NBI05535.1 DUF2680 domain-containing protein [Senegalia massiliensis]
MKKFLSVLLISALVFSAGVVAFADGDGSVVPEWFRDKMEWQKDRIDEGVKNGDITPEQAEDYKERLNEVEEYHNENGFDNEEYHGPGMGFRRGQRDGKRNGYGGYGGFGGYCHNY